MSRWNHSTCMFCWLKREPDRDPVIMTKAPTETCCFCGDEHSTGIYVREDPENTRCKGEHP